VRTPKKLAVYVLVSLALLSVGCKRETPQGPSAAAPAARREALIRVGSILDLTGVGASYGKRMKQAFQLAINDAREGTEGAPVPELLFEDFQWDTAKALTAYRKLVSVENVGIIVGITGSRNATPVVQASKTDDVVIIDALTSSPTLTRQGGPNYFRVMASDALAGRFNATWAGSAGMRRAAIMFVEDEWGVSYRDELKRYLASEPEIQVVTQGAPVGSRDYHAQIAKIKSFNPDTIFLLLYPPDGGAFMQQSRQDGLNAIVYGSDNLSAPEFADPGAEIVEGVRLALPAAVAGPAYESFKQRYAARYQEEADTIAAKSYDAMAVAIDAIKRVGSAPAAIRELLKSPDYSFDGLTGRIEFDKNGDLRSQQYTKMVFRNGKLVPFTSSPK
jgi:branched-chain amino acid transport system substrate-binding protein